MVGDGSGRVVGTMKTGLGLGLPVPLKLKTDLTVASQKLGRLVNSFISNNIFTRNIGW